MVDRSSGVRPGEIIGHGDLGPWNTIWRDHEPVAFIDWDFAEPGPAVEDLAELAFFTVPMPDDAHGVECDLLPRVTDAIDLASRSLPTAGWMAAPALDAAERLWEVDIRRIETLGLRGTTPWDGFSAG